MVSITRVLITGLSTILLSGACLAIDATPPVLREVLEKIRRAETRLHSSLRSDPDGVALVKSLWNKAQSGPRDEYDGHQRVLWQQPEHIHAALQALRSHLDCEAGLSAKLYLGFIMQDMYFLEQDPFRMRMFSEIVSEFPETWQGRAARLRLFGQAFVAVNSKQRSVGLYPYDEATRRRAEALLPEVRSLLASTLKHHVADLQALQATFPNPEWPLANEWVVSAQNRVREILRFMGDREQLRAHLEGIKRAHKHAKQGAPGGQKALELKSIAEREIEWLDKSAPPGSK